MAESVSFAGRTLHGYDSFGRWITSNIEGWLDSPEVKGESVDRSNADGEFDLPVFNQSRIITVTGAFLPKSEKSSYAGMNALTSAMRGTFEVAGYGPTQVAEVKRAGSVKFTHFMGHQSKWQVQLKAVDPRKFGPERRYPILYSSEPVQTQDTAMVRQYGNYSGFVVAEMRGDFPGGYRLIGPAGNEFRVTAALLPGQAHRVDFSEGILQIDGVYTSGFVPVADVWAIPADTDVTIRLEPLTTGTGSADLFVRDTYI